MGHGNAIYVDIKDYSNYGKRFTRKSAKRTGSLSWDLTTVTRAMALFISEEDFGNLSRYQRLWDKAVTVVIDPFLINGKSVRVQNLPC